MRFKLDENLPIEAAEVLQNAGHDAATIYSEGLTGVDDMRIAQVCKDEQRALVSLDLGFSDIRNYPPSAYEGIIVLRTKQQDKPHLLKIVERLSHKLAEGNLSGKLWIVDEKNIRVRS